MNPGIYTVIYAGLFLMIMSAADKITGHMDNTAVRMCQIEHSYDTCFGALNR